MPTFARIAAIGGMLMAAGVTLESGIAAGLVAAGAFMVIYGAAWGLCR